MRKRKIYPDFAASTGYGTGAGLCGWNCRHSFGPYVEGAPRVWTDEKLAELNEPKYEYNGEKLTEYEAQQRENYFNRQIHRWNREAEAMRSAGQNPSEARAKARAWGARKRDFLEYRTNMRISKTNTPIHFVGRIDKSIYECLGIEPMTDEVVITEERIVHIKMRHPNDFELFYKRISEIVANPDYIVEANKPNTAVLLKEFVEDDERFKVILRIKVESDPTEYKNSIMSFWKVGNATWKKTLRNKKILYKHE